MKSLVMKFEQFINESSNSEAFNSIVREVLLRNKHRIIVDSDTSEDVFNKVLDKMSETRPESIDEDSLINDAIVYSISIKPEVEIKNEWEELDSNPDSKIPQFQNDQSII